MNEFRKIGTFAKSVSRKNFDKKSSADVYSVTKYDGFVRSLDYFKKQVFSRDLSTYKIVRKGEFAYSTIHLDEGAIGLFQGNEALISPMYTVFEVDKSVDIFYLNHLLSSDLLLTKFGLIGQGSVNRRKFIPFSSFADLEVRIPPLHEQKKIVEILSTIDKLLIFLKRKKNKLTYLKFGLFNELIINNKKAKLRKISEICSSSSGGTPDRSNSNYFKGNIPWVKSGEVKGLDILQTEEQITNEAIKNSSAKIIKSGSVLIAMYGATAGQSALLKVNAATNQAVLALSINSNCIDNKYLYHALLASRNNLLLSCQGSGQPNLSSTLIKDFLIPVPELTIQNKINKNLNSLLKNIDSLTLKISRIKELKKSICSELFLEKGGY